MRVAGFGFSVVYNRGILPIAVMLVAENFAEIRRALEPETQNAP